MSFLKKKLLQLTLFLLFSSLLAIIQPEISNSSVLAQSAISQDFNIKTTTQAQVNEQGFTTITQNFSITNLVADKYLTNYIVQISSTQITDVKVENEDDSVSAQTATKNNQTIITIKFDEEIVGEGKENRFQLTYQSPAFAKILGDQVLEVNLPVPDLTTFTTDTEYTLTTPAKFGLPVRTIPDSTTSENKDDRILTTFALSPNQPPTSLRASFGAEQAYLIENNFEIENNHETNVHYQLALIPDTPTQKITYLNLHPQPTKLAIDEDYNWIATYELKPQEKIALQLKALAQVSLLSDPTIPTTFINDHNRNIYTAPQKYWETNTQSVSSVSQTLTGAEAINKFLVENFTYDHEKIADLNNLTRVGATISLETKTGACSEFTDSFVALARHQNIPTRAHVGYAANQEQNLNQPASNLTFHTWPEFYDDHTQAWQQIDPTWENTARQDYFHTFDLSHLTMAINGHNSELPNPLPSETMVISFVPEQQVQELLTTATLATNSATASLPLTLIPHENFFLNFVGFRQLQITNHTGQAFYNLELQLLTTASQHSVPPLVFKMNDQSPQANQISLPYLLPYSSQSVTIRPANFLDLPLNQLQPQLNYQLNLIQNPGPNYVILVNQPLTISFFLSPPLAVLASGIFTATLLTGCLLVFRRR